MGQCERGDCGVTANGHRVSFEDDEHVLELDCGDAHTTLNTLKSTPFMS